MLFHLLTNGGHAAGVGFNRLNVRRRRIGRCAKQILQNPNTSQDRLGFHAIGSSGKNASLPQQAAPVMFRPQAYALEFLMRNVRYTWILLSATA